MKNDIKNAILSKERWIINYLTEDLFNVDVNGIDLDLKIAIQISGGLRTFEYMIPWINKFVINPLNADVFIHGWANNLGVEENLSKIKEYSNLKLFKINDINDDEFKFLKRTDVTQGKIYGNYFNVYECNKLRKKYELENNIKYDLIVKCRPCAFFFCEFDKSNIKYIFDNNCVGIPVEYYKIWSSIITDVFAIAKPEIMDKYCDCYSLLNESSNHFLSPEEVLSHNLNKNMVYVDIYDILPNFVIDYPLFLPFDELDKVNTRLYY